MTALPSFPLQERQAWSGQAPRYARGVLDLLQLNTMGTAYPARLQALDALWAWSGSRTTVVEAVLDADLAAVSCGVGCILLHL